MSKIIILSDFCVAEVSESGFCESCGDTDLPTITFEYSEYSFKEDDKIDTEHIDAIYCYACFYNCSDYEKHMSFIPDEKLKEVIIEYCNNNIEIDYKTTYYKTILEECNSIKDRESLLELFEKVGWDSKID